MVVLIIIADGLRGGKLYLNTLRTKTKAQFFRNEIIALRLLLERCLKEGILERGFIFLGSCI